jgi:hypothetical protein
MNNGEGSVHLKREWGLWCQEPEQVHSQGTASYCRPCLPFLFPGLQAIAHLVPVKCCFLFRFADYSLTAQKKVIHSFPILQDICLFVWLVTWFLVLVLLLLSIGLTLSSRGYVARCPRAKKVSWSWNSDSQSTKKERGHCWQAVTGSSTSIKMLLLIRPNGLCKCQPGQPALSKNLL